MSTVSRFAVADGQRWTDEKYEAVAAAGEEADPVGDGGDAA